MKKILFTYLSLIVILFAFSACHSEKMDWGMPQGSGELSLVSLKMDIDLNVDTVLLHPKTRAGVDLNKFLVSIYNTDELMVEQFVYSEMPDIISLPVGKYTIEVTSAAEASSGFDVPFYKGSTEVTLKENEITEGVSVSCTLANVMIVIEYDDDIRKAMGDDVVTVVSLAADSLVIPISEERIGYLVAPASEEGAMMEINMRGTVDGIYVTRISKIDNVKAGQLNLIEYKFEPVGGDQNLAINIDSSMTSSDETVGVNPGKEQGIEDFPTEGDGSSSGDGGEETDASISITGKNIGGSSFNIDQPQTITDETILIVGIEASEGIQNLKVKISSDNDEFNEIGSGLGEFDLAHSNTMNDTAQDLMSQLGLPLDGDVLNQISLDFDISSFTSMLLGFKGTHTFTITVVDNKGNKLSKSLVVNIPA